ncbi:MAG: lysophospholipid acyltransferase family protein [Duncaniella sp.]|nr:lysophospholipid acyltransferase family protein [Duncaniella sp.]MDE6582170.1 lysophospholipid acyltransferase family protein [Duncaniella sp.]
MDYSSYDIHPVVLGYDEIVALAPQLKGKRRIVEGLIRFLSIGKCNDLHSRLCDTPGPDFCRRMIEELDIKLKIDNAELLDHLPEGPFVTVSNHPFGAMDGVTLIDIIGSRRPEFKVMVNMTLNYISALRPSFIAVDSLASDDPVKKAVSVRGLKEAMSRIRDGHPVGFFPAGAVAKLNWRLRLEDREWQPTIIRLIKKMNVPVIPIYFHGSNSWWFNFLGVVSWQLRTLRLPAEIFKKAHKTIHISIGEPISVEEQKEHGGSLEELGRFLREKTFDLRRK